MKLKKKIRICDVHQVSSDGIFIFICMYINEAANRVTLQLHLRHGFILQFLKSNIDYVQSQGEFSPSLPPNEKICGAYCTWR